VVAAAGVVVVVAADLVDQVFRFKSIKCALFSSLVRCAPMQKRQCGIAQVVF
jgi:hypothetical protein